MEASDRDPSPGADDDGDATPRWVKVSGAIFIPLVVVFAAVHIAGRGLHGHGPPARGAALLPAHDPSQPGRP